MKAEQTAKLDEEMRRAPIDEETTDKIMGLFKDFERFKKLSLEEMEAELKKEGLI